MADVAKEVLDIAHHLRATFHHVHRSVKSKADRPVIQKEKEDVCLAKAGVGRQVCLGLMWIFLLLLSLISFDLFLCLFSLLACLVCFQYSSLILYTALFINQANIQKKVWKNFLPKDTRPTTYKSNIKHKTRHK
eukprot:TRINITY_DN60274_c0_g1_i1.p1 TRINITY_DN60274_c0_g1~~TRINITY_DN60274_c0_g1_i1.p1  ORF type:complete len:134 (-),score=9.50 TRINITY_DN60274_c0_g1_i1:3-404(-)